jgi:hypothetical protein
MRSMSGMNSSTIVGLTTLFFLSLPACGSSGDPLTPCSALAECCAALSSDEAAACQATTSSLTQTQCADALQGYQETGLCQGIYAGSADGGGTLETAAAIPAGNSCYEVTGSGETQVCVSVSSTASSGGCSSLAGMTTGTCPGDGLYGCCVNMMTFEGNTTTTGACYYSDLVGEEGESTCAGTWSSTPP